MRWPWMRTMEKTIAKNERESEWWRRDGIVNKVV